MAQRVMQAVGDLISGVPGFGVVRAFRMIRANKRADQFFEEKELEKARVELECAIDLFQGQNDNAKARNPGYHGHLLGRLATTLSDLRHWTEAIDVHQEAIDLTRNEIDLEPREQKNELSRMLRNFGNTLVDFGDIPKARSAYEESLSIRRELAEEYGEYFNLKVATTLQSYAGLLGLCGDPDSAIDAYEEALSLLKSDTQGSDREVLSITADVLYGLSVVYDEISNYELARSISEEVVMIRRKIKDGPGLAEALKALANFEEQLGLLELAEKHIGESVSLLEEFVERMPGAYLSPLASSLNNQGNVLSARQQYLEAEFSYDKAIRIRRDLAHSLPQAHAKSLASSLINYGSMKGGIGELNAARRAHEEASMLLEQGMIGSDEKACPEQARALYNLGNACCQLCDFEGGRVAFTKAAKIQKELVVDKPYRFESKLAKTLGGLGTVLQQLGDYEASKNTFSRALLINRKLEKSGTLADLENLSYNLVNYSNTLASLGLENESIEACEEAIRCERELGSRRGEDYSSDLAASLHNLGCSLVGRHDGLDDIRRAAECFSEAVAIRSKLDSSENATLAGELACSRCALGKLLLQLGEFEDGLKLVQQAAKGYQQVCQLEPDSFQRYRIDAYSVYAEVLLHKYSLTHDRSYLDEAYHWLGEAAGIGESLRFRYVNPARRRKHSEHLLSGVLCNLVACCIEMWFLNPEDTSKLEEAVTHSEQGRMRALLDTIQVDLKPANTPKELVDLYRATRSNVLALSEQLHFSETAPKTHSTTAPFTPNEGSPSSRDLANFSRGNATETLKAEFYAACDSYHAILSKIRKDYDPLFDPEGSSGVVSVMKVRRALGSEDTAAVQYTFTDVGCYAIVIYEDNIEAIRLPALTGESLTSKSKEWLDSMDRCRDDRGLDSSKWQPHAERILEWLSDTVIRPSIKDVRPEIQHLLFVPHKDLHLFPIGSCAASNVECLSDRFELSIAPSLSLFCECRARNYEKLDRVVCIELPNQSLPSQSLEAQLLEQHFQNRVVRKCLSGGRLEELRELGEHRADIWHYCGHGKFDADNPLGSTLGDRGPESSYTLRDLFVSLNLPTTRLAVLSACETGMLNPDSMDDHVGFPGALLRAGAKCVISTLWEVQDIATMLLIDRFYKRLREGRSIASALQDSQRWLRGVPDSEGESLSSGDALLRYVKSAHFAANFDSEKEHLQCIEDAKLWGDGEEQPPFRDMVYWGAFVASGDCSQLL